MFTSGIIYFAELQNFTSLFMMSLYGTYFYKRIQNPGQKILPNADLNMDPQEQLFWIVSNTLLTSLTAFYVLFYCRVYEHFSMFVRVCIFVVKDLVNFTIFLVFWIILIS